MKLIGRRLIQMILILIVASIILFIIFDSDTFKMRIALAELGNFGVSAMDPDDYKAWLVKKGLDIPFYQRFMLWVGNALQGDLGWSFEKNTPVGPLLWAALKNTGILAFWVFALMVPLSLILGVLAGMREGSRLDRSISFISVFTTPIPPKPPALIRPCSSPRGLKWLPTKSAMISGFDGWQLMLPVMTLVLYDFGYVARMTRASMAEVMTSQYIRTAVLKGLPYRRVILRHALRNALIAPFTVIVLQLNWLLSGVVVVEVFFEYKGFGKLLLEAALFGDIYVVQACTLVAVIVAVTSQIISDIGYTFLNPRIRFA